MRRAVRRSLLSGRAPPGPGPAAGFALKNCSAAMTERVINEPTVHEDAFACNHRTVCRVSHNLPRSSRSDYRARICVEYFTIRHAPVFGTQDPTLMGLGWGIFATWWAGLRLGIPTDLAALVGKRPKRGEASLVRPTRHLLAVTAQMLSAT